MHEGLCECMHAKTGEGCVVFTYPNITRWPWGAPTAKCASLTEDT